MDTRACVQVFLGVVYPGESDWLNKEGKASTVCFIKLTISTNSCCLLLSKISICCGKGGGTDFSASIPSCSRVVPWTLDPQQFQAALAWMLSDFETSKPQKSLGEKLEVGSTYSSNGFSTKRWGWEGLKWPIEASDLPSNCIPVFLLHPSFRTSLICLKQNACYFPVEKFSGALPGITWNISLLNIS